MVINYGSGKIAESLVNDIRFGKIAMRQVLSEILVLVVILLTLHILYEILLIAVNGEATKVLSKVFNELIFAGFLVFIMMNWLGGINLLENIIEPLMFQKIPQYMFSFKVGNRELFVTDGVLLNIDKLWKTLEEIPNKIYDMKAAWKIFFEWVLISNLGYHLIMILLKMFMYVVIILFFADILRMILGVHLMYIFSGISFVLMTFKPLRENYGMAIPKTLLATSIQYYMTFIIVGLSAGYMNYLYSVGGKFIHIVGVFILMGLIKGMMNQISRIGSKL